MSNIQLLHEDNMSVMARYTDGYFDLAVVDPPYGIGDKFRGGSTGSVNFNEIVDKGWDNETPKAEYWKELFRVSKNQIVWGGNYFLEYLPSTRCFIFWDKCISEDMSLSMGELAWTSLDERAKAVKIYNPKGDKIHSTQKPIKLYQWIYANYAKPNFKILDTHLGSGSNAIAAHQFGVSEFVGCEIDREYYESAVKRFDLVTSQQLLFQSA